MLYIMMNVINGDIGISHAKLYHFAKTNLTAGRAAYEEKS